MGSVAHVFCSDTARIGKTLLARVFADLCSLRRENSPVVFDTDMSGNGIINYLPEKTQLIDLSIVADQVTMFDMMMDPVADPQDHGCEGKAGKGRRAPDYIIDVATNEFSRFFELFRDIGFERGAVETGLDVRIYYLVNWSLPSLLRTVEIRSLLTTSKFFAARNMGVQAYAFTPRPDDADRVPELDISVFLNALSPRVFAIVNEEGFSFARFISGEYKSLRQVDKGEILNFLEGIYNQTRHCNMA